jgi:hypothetical protein
MTTVVADLRYAARELRRQPGACLATARRAAAIDPMHALRLD